MAYIIIEDGNVTVQLSRLDHILAFHGSLRIPLGHVKGARVENQSAWNQMWRKIIGTSAPGVKMAGTFWIDGGWAFVDYGSGENCVVIDTEHETYKHIIVQPDPDQDALSIVAKINAGVTSVSR